MRRRRSFGTRLITMLGNTWTKVEDKIKENIKNEVALFAPFPVDHTEMIEHSVAPYVINALRAAHAYKSGYDSTTGAILYQTPSGHSVSFTVDFTNTSGLVPKPDYIVPDQWLLERLNPWAETFMAIYRKWMVVRHVANWFDTNASVAACRYYWPVMMALLPQDSPKLQELHAAGIGTHLKEPKGIGMILPLARETATYVTAGQLLPDRDPNDTSKKVNLHLRSCTFNNLDHIRQSHIIAGMDIKFDF